jgi:hypothetical protein
MRNIAVIIAGLLLLAGCHKSLDTPGYSNTLTLGTGLNPTDVSVVIGVGTSFSKSAPIYFKLESQRDISGSTVRIQVTRENGTFYNNFDFINTPESGHVFISNFTITDAGSFKVTGILMTGNKTVASRLITVN